ncbi:MAG TPA: hypothetical protein VFR91_00410 [Dyella sp.]|nr:hypothetical protein [Dyella sp.]
MRNAILRALVLMAALACSSHAVAMSTAACTATKPAHCTSVNPLVWSVTFRQRIGHFLGNAKVSYFQADRPLASQALLGLGGPPDPPVALGGGRYLFSACPPHDCGGNAAATILDGSGRVLAVGFSSFHCSEGCESERYVDLYVRGPQADASLVAALKAWATGPRVRSLLADPGVDEALGERTAIHLLR